jgi:hypothetical protein
MKTTTSTALRTLVVGSRPLRFKKGWHVKTTLRDVSHFAFPGLLLIALSACGGSGGDGSGGGGVTSGSASSSSGGGYLVGAQSPALLGVASP